MTLSMIKIQPVKSSSEKHNNRLVGASYLIPGSNENINNSNQSIAEKRAELERLAKEKTGRKMQAKATPIREAVVLLPDDDNDFNSAALFKLTDKLEEEYGIKCFQWHIHNDEGHFSEEDQEYKYNYHAHLVFDWMDHETGKSLKIDKEQMSDIQDITAECLEMKRGVKGSQNVSLNHHEYRKFIRLRDELKAEFKQDLKKEQEIKIRQEIIKERGNGRDKEQQTTDKGGKTKGIRI